MDEPTDPPHEDDMQSEHGYTSDDDSDIDDAAAQPALAKKAAVFDAAAATLAIHGALDHAIQLVGSSQYIRQAIELQELRRIRGSDAPPRPKWTELDSLLRFWDQNSDHRVHKRWAKDVRSAANPALLAAGMDHFAAPRKQWWQVSKVRNLQSFKKRIVNEAGNMIQAASRVKGAQLVGLVMLLDLASTQVLLSGADSLEAFAEAISLDTAYMGWCELRRAAERSAALAQHSEVHFAALELCEKQLIVRALFALAIPEGKRRAEYPWNAGAMLVQLIGIVRQLDGGHTPLIELLGHA